MNNFLISLVTFLWNDVDACFVLDWGGYIALLRLLYLLDFANTP